MTRPPRAGARAALAPALDRFRSLYRSPGRRIDLAVWFVLSALLYLGLRFGYAAPFYATDSGTYLTAAQEHAFSPYRPPGYAAFIRFVHAVNPHLGSICAAQFFLHAFSVLVLYLAVVTACQPRSLRFFRAAFLLALALPSLLFCANYLMSDSLFVSLTLFWMAAMIWSLSSRSWPALGAVVLAGALAASVRYAGLVYPVGAALLLGALLPGRVRRLAAVAAQVALLLAIYGGTRESFRTHTGLTAFTPFGGWARANNASVVIPYVRHDLRRPAAPEIAELHEVHLLLPDTYYSIDSVMATASMWSENYPGKRACFAMMREIHTHYIQAWVEMGRRLGRYGDWLIRTYPLLYFEKFLVPNTVQALRSFDCPGGSEIRLSPALVQWLHESRSVWPYRPGWLEQLWGAEEALKYLLWVLSLGALVFLIRQRRRLGPGGLTWKVTLLTAGTGLLFVLFSISSHPVNCFRYLLPVHVLQLLLVALAATGLLEKRRRNPAGGNLADGRRAGG